MLTRRHFLASVGVAGVGLTGKALNQSELRMTDWTVIFDETWDTFNTDRWGVGFVNPEEWIPNDDASVSAEHVSITDGSCHLQIESDGTGPDGCYQGVLNTSVGGKAWHPENGVPIKPSPPVYVEADIQLPAREGILPAFWMHPADGTWPPEIDIVELIQDGSADQRSTLQTDVHWSRSGSPGDQDTHRHDPVAYQTTDDLTKTTNTYGCAWFPDRIEWFFNGNLIRTRALEGSVATTLSDATAQPFGIIFSNHVNRIGTADLSTSWIETMRIDRVRVLQKLPGSRSTTIEF